MDANGGHDMEHEEPTNRMGDMPAGDSHNWPVEAGGNDATPGKLFVGGLSWQTSTDKLREYFSIFGTVEEVVIMMDPVTQRSRGFGFVTFTDPDAVDKVLKVPIHTLDGKKIDPKCATPKIRGRGGGSRTKKIFVGGISQDTTAEEVKEYFGQFGRVQECVMLIDQQTKRHRGFGFVIFDCEEIVDEVCEIHFHTIKNKKVECKKAQTKEAIQSDLQKNPSSGGSASAPPPPQPPLGSASQMAAVQAQAYLQAAIAAIAAQAQTAALAGNGKFMGGHPGLGSFRYTPYPMPGGLAGIQQAAAALGAAAAASQSSGGGGPSQPRPGGMGARGGGGGGGGRQAPGGGSPSSQRGAVRGDPSYFGSGDSRRQGGSMGSFSSQMGNAGGGPMNNPFQGSNFNMPNFPGVDLESVFGMGM